MKVIGVGIDIVNIGRIARLMERYGPRFESHILHHREREQLEGRDRVAFMAKRFAAKEALGKALGTGLAHGVRFGEIEVTHNERGRPGLELHGGTLAVALKLGVSETHLSLSDEREYAVAYVLLTG